MPVKGTCLKSPPCSKVTSCFRTKANIECNFTLQVAYGKKAGIYRIAKSYLEHNHELSRNEFMAGFGHKLTEEEKSRYAPLIVDRTLSAEALIEKIQVEVGKKISVKDVRNLQIRTKVDTSAIFSRQLELEAAPLVADRLGSNHSGSFFNLAGFFLKKFISCYLRLKSVQFTERTNRERENRAGFFSRRPKYSRQKKLKPRKN